MRARSPQDIQLTTLERRRCNDQRLVIAVYIGHSTHVRRGHGIRPSRLIRSRTARDAPRKLASAASRRQGPSPVHPTRRRRTTLAIVATRNSAAASAGNRFCGGGGNGETMIGHSSRNRETKLLAHQSSPTPASHGGRGSRCDGGQAEPLQRRPCNRSPTTAESMQHPYGPVVPWRTDSVRTPARKAAPSGASPAEMTGLARRAFTRTRAIAC